MGSCQPFVFGFVFACVGLGDARFLGRTVPNNWGVEDQRPAQPEAAAESDISSVKSAQQASGHEPSEEPLSWKFPQDPVDLEPLAKPLVRLEEQQGQQQGQPPPIDRMAVRCGEDRIQVEVSQDMLSLSRLIQPEEMTLGNCSATDVDDSSQVLIFESELHSCDSTLVMTDKAFIYAFALAYNPKVSSRSPIFRSQSFVIGVECHYLK